MKKYYVADLQEGAKVEDVFLVTWKSVSQTRGGSPFLKLKLTDKSGTIDAIKWDVTESEISKIIPDKFAFIHGTVRTYNGDLQLTIDTCKKCDEDIDPADFIACSTLDRDQMMAELLRLLGTISNPHLQQLADSFFGNNEFCEKFIQAPAATKVHHAYIGGLLEHTLNVTRACAAMAELYPEASRDVLLIAAALHDAGKIEEFEWTNTIKYSDLGHAIGHIVTGAMMVKEAASKIEGFDPTLSLALQHAILSHHGLKEYGSPVLPESIEAMILHSADDLDAKAAMVRKAKEEADTNGDAGLFTKRHFFLDRPIFRGLPQQEESEESSGNVICQNNGDKETFPVSGDNNGGNNEQEYKLSGGLFDADLLAADDYDPFADN